MTILSVFYKLSELQDFREAVSKASGQSGKPVIEERLLDQILYYLPQLYELNQDLLRELQLRVAKWYLNTTVYALCFYICVTAVNAFALPPRRGDGTNLPTYIFVV